MGLHRSAKGVLPLPDTITVSTSLEILKSKFVLDSERGDFLALTGLPDEAGEHFTADSGEEVAGNS